MALSPGRMNAAKGSLSARITRQSGTSFYYAFRILPGAKRRAIYSLYSFCRVVDDCVDEPGGEGEAGLQRWLEEVQACYTGRPTTELGRELAEALEAFPIPRRCFEDIVEGCRMDLVARRYDTFADLRAYCEKVASAVGLASIEIFGYRNPATRAYAVELGVALQLTNILRDVVADGALGRLYVPLDELARFGVSEPELTRPAAPRRPEVTALLDHQGARARGQYASASARLPAEDRRAMASAEVMGALYRALLDELERRSWPLGGPRLRLSTSRRVWIAARTLARVHLGA